MSAAATSTTTRQLRAPWPVQIQLKHQLRQVRPLSQFQFVPAIHMVLCSSSLKVLGPSHCFLHLCASLSHVLHQRSSNVSGHRCSGDLSFYLPIHSLQQHSSHSWTMTDRSHYTETPQLCISRLVHSSAILLSRLLFFPWSCSRPGLSAIVQSQKHSSICMCMVRALWRLGVHHLQKPKLAAG